MTIPARTAGVPIRLVILRGQKSYGSQAFFQPFNCFRKLNLSVCGTPLLELNHRSAYLLVQNLTNAPIQVMARQPLGMLVDSSFHDFELTIPVIGALPPSLTKDDNPEEPVFTSSTHMIAIIRHEALQSEAICSATLGTEGDLVVYSLVTQPGDPPPSDPEPGLLRRNLDPLSITRSISSSQKQLH